MSVGYGLGYEMVGGEVEDVVRCGVEKGYDDHGVECFFPKNDMMLCRRNRQFRLRQVRTLGKCSKAGQIQLRVDGGVWSRRACGAA